MPQKELSKDKVNYSRKKNLVEITSYFSLVTAPTKDHFSHFCIFSASLNKYYCIFTPK